MIEEVYVNWGSGEEDVLMWGLSPSDNNTQINTYKTQYGITNPCAGTQGGGPAAINTVIAGQPFYGYPTYVVVCPDNTMSFDVCWPPPGASCFDTYIQDCIDNTLMANFSSDVTEVCEGQQVQFWDNSTGNVITWSWTFFGGDPETSTEQNPVVTYNTAGVYGVELFVSNGTTNSTFGLLNYITVYQLPATTLQPFADVCLDDPAFELTGGFPEGGTYSGNGVAAGWFDPMIAGAGTHTIVYTYIDPEGCENSAQQDIYVDPCTGISEPGASHFKIYPNPSDGKFILHADIQGAWSVRIVDLLGTGVFDSEGIADGNVEQFIDLRDQSGGIYFITVKCGEEYFVRKLKVIK